MKITPGLQARLVVVAAILQARRAARGRQRERAADADMVFFGDLLGDGDPAAFAEPRDRRARVPARDLAVEHLPVGPRRARDDPHARR